jgi:hypothetical protein
MNALARSWCHFRPNVLGEIKYAHDAEIIAIKCRIYLLAAVALGRKFSKDQSLNLPEPLFVK